MLHYTGGGIGGYHYGIPARDLTDEEVERFGGEKALIRTGLYEKSQENKALGGASEGKNVPQEVGHGRK